LATPNTFTETPSISASLHDHILGDLQSDRAVDAALTAVVVLMVRVQRHDFETKEV
jgi:hypothetical protein